jgi:FkbM family methyltransferase
MKKINFDLFKFLKIALDTKPKHAFYNKKYKSIVKELIQIKNVNKKKKKINFFFCNDISIINSKLGNLYTADLFNFDEIIIFLFYFLNKYKYKKAIDIGANVGLHSIILGKLKYNTLSFEPDPKTFQITKKNIKINKLKNVKLFNCAISNIKKIATFTRIKNNLTGSHISGAKNKVYGPIDIIKVKTKNLNQFINTEKTLVKIDAEGHEAEIMNSLKQENISRADFLIECNNIENSKIIFNLVKKNKLRCYSQKNNWKICTSITNLPKNYKEGTIFISKKNTPWN